MASAAPAQTRWGVTLCIQSGMGLTLVVFIMFLLWVGDSVPERRIDSSGRTVTLVNDERGGAKSTMAIALATLMGSWSLGVRTPGDDYAAERCSRPIAMSAVWQRRWRCAAPRNPKPPAPAHRSGPAGHRR